MQRRKLTIRVILERAVTGGIELGPPITRPVKKLRVPSDHARKPGGQPIQITPIICLSVGRLPHGPCVTPARHSQNLCLSIFHFGNSNRVIRDPRLTLNVRIPA
jgi:hypothetical protein